MKLVAPEEGRSLQLISMDELRPLRGVLLQQVIANVLIEKYHFSANPTTFEQNAPVKLFNGFSEEKGTIIPIIEMNVYSDGVLVSTRHTDDSDLILDGLIEWAVAEMGLRRPTTNVPRQHLSRLIVDIDGGLERMSKALEQFSALISRAINQNDDDNLTIVDLKIGPTPGTQYPYQRTWHMETRIVEPHVPGRYLSTAPLSSTAHYELLERIEEALRGI